MHLNNKVSVIISAYNVGRWLPRCVDSVINQTYQNLEIILIDDGSTDDTGSIIDKYASLDERVVAVHQDNAGLVAVREKGIALSTGEYVGFVDGDDVIEPEFYEKLLTNAVKYDADISHCGMKYCFYDGRVKLHNGTGEVIEFNNYSGLTELLSGTKVEPSLCNKLYKRELLPDSCLDSSVTNNEDLLRNYILFSRAKKSVFEDFCGYQYWRRAESMSNKGFNAKACNDVLRARSLIFEKAPVDIKDVSFQSYLNALVFCYNSAIGSSLVEANAMRSHCLKELSQFSKRLKNLPKGLYLRVAAILYCRCLYHPLYLMHERNVYRRIRKEAKKV